MVISIIKEVADELVGMSMYLEGDGFYSELLVASIRCIEYYSTSIKKYTDKEVGNAGPDSVMSNREVVGGPIVVLVVIEKP
jgi:hypothetical protein